MIKTSKRKLSILLAVLVLLSLIVPAYAQLGTVDSPPRLRDMEVVLVQIVYFAWGAGGAIFTVILISIGFRYMFQGGDQQAQQELKDKGKRWAIGLVAFFLAYPVVLTFYNVAGIGGTGSECYEGIDTPGFHFFFPTVCTDPLAESTNALGNPCSGGTLPDNKCCSSGAIMPVGVGVQWAATGTVNTFKRDPSSNNCVITDICSYTPGSGCSCTYRYDSSADPASKFVTGCIE